MKLIIYTAFTTCVCTIYWNLTLLHFFIVFLELFFLFYLLSRVGHKFVYLELLALITVTQWLLGPVIAERFETKMAIPYDEYFAFALPATLAYLIGLTYPIWKQKELDRKTSYIFLQLQTICRSKQRWGMILILVGAPFWIFINRVPSDYYYIFFLFSNLILIGICLLLFTDYKWKWLWISTSLFLLIVTTVLNGMVGSIIIWLFAIGMLYTIKNPIRIHFAFKLLYFLLFVWFIAILQVSKTEYRLLTWNIKTNELTGYVNREIKQDPGLFYSLIKKKITDPKTLTRPKSILALAGRINQGYLVSLAMDYVPMQREFGGGEVTLYNTAIAFIPRILWKSKPIIGQAEYFKKYTGIKLTKYTSSTIGPLGDAYVDYGWWAILFLGLFGFMIGAMFQVWINMSLGQPVLLLWFMILYLSSITLTEVSIAGFVNGIFKYIIFIFAMRLILRTIGIKV